MAAQKAQCISANPISWDSGPLFNGYCLLLMALPSATSTPWTQVALKDTNPPVRVPTRAKIMIREGVVDVEATIWRTDSIVPPGVLYTAYYYDNNDRLIRAEGNLFSVTTDTIDITPTSLPLPTESVDIPLPEDVPAGEPAPVLPWIRVGNNIYYLSGNVGIGTSAPSGILHIYSDQGTSLNDRPNSSALPSTFYARTARGSTGVPSALQAGDFLGRFAFGGFDGVSWTAQNQAMMQGNAAENWTTSARGSYLSFSTTAIGNLLGSERLRIDPSGNVGIGTTNPTSKLQVVDLPVYANNAAAIAGNLTAGAFYRTGADPDLVCVVH